MMGPTTRNNERANLQTGSHVRRGPTRGLHGPRDVPYQTSRETRAEERTLTKTGGGAGGKNKNTSKGGKGEGKGKRKNKGKGKGKKGRGAKRPFVSMPAPLIGLDSHDENGEPYCFDANLGTCTKAKWGEKCPKGWHKCMKRGCKQLHAYVGNH